MDSYYSMFKSVQDKLGIIPVDGIAVGIATYMISPQTDKIKNTLIIGAIHGILHYETCRIQMQDGLI